MKTFTIAVIAGDGVGPEVIPQGKRVLETVGEKTQRHVRVSGFRLGRRALFPLGPHDAGRRHRPAAALRRHSIWAPSAIPQIPDHITLNGLLLPIRRVFDQYANVRPAYLYPGVQFAAGRPQGRRDRLRGGAREHRGRIRPGGRLRLPARSPKRSPSRPACSRGAASSASCGSRFELAVKRNQKKRVTSVTKSNAQGYSMVLWDRTFQEVAAQYPDVETESLLVDAAAMNFIRRPQSFDVVVASNLFGDILSDLSATIIGSMGLAASANLDPERRFPSMFEPVHGSAPDIAGKGIVNPLATILSAAMMLDHLEMTAAAEEVEAAVAAVLAEGKVRPPDLGGKSSTEEVAAAVLEKLA